jgi:UDP-N-acetylmuramate dehydrogenase
VKPAAGKAPAVSPVPVKAAKAGKAPRRPSTHPALPPFPSDRIPGIVKADELLSRHTTLRIGGPAALHLQPANAEAVHDALVWAQGHGVPWLVLGLGSNVLIRDRGFQGLVLKLGKGLDAVTAKAGTWKVESGLPTPILARRTAEAGMAGLQRLVGVPGTVGGGVFMNAGAHGQDFATVVQSVTVLTAAGTVEERPRKAVPFSYRRSGLDGCIVLGCTLKLEEERPDRLKSDLAMLLKKRREGTPFDLPCCGSVFKNPDLMTAGRLIDRCGLKGRRVGGAEISNLHANYIVNRGGATADDVLKLIDIVRTAVFKEFGVELELEVKVLGVK